MSAPKTAKRSQLLSVTEAAQRLSCSRGHVHNLIAVGALRSVELRATGNRSKARIYEADLEAFIAARTRTG